MQQMYERIARRAFERFEGEGGAPGRDVEHWLQAEAELLHPVAINLTETDDVLTVQAEVPGFEAGELQLCIEPERLTVSGRKESKEEQKKGNTIYQEQRASEVLRALSLPAAVDASKAFATLRNGMLEIVLPKASEVRPGPAETKGV
jgi:HSP20 family protein